jgi:hypothetical protein
LRRSHRQRGFGSAGHSPSLATPSDWATNLNRKMAFDSGINNGTATNQVTTDTKGFVFAGSTNSQRVTFNGNQGITVAGADMALDSFVDRGYGSTAGDLGESFTAGIGKRTVTISSATNAALGAVLTGTVNVGAVLPTNARIIGAEVNVTTKVQNVGDTDTTVIDVGVSGDTECVVKDVSLKSTGRKGDGPAGDSTGYPGQRQSAAQLIATITSDVNLNTITAGALVVDVFFFVFE